MSGGFVLPTVLVTTTIIVGIVSVQVFNSITSDRSSRSKLFTILNDSASESIFYSYRSLLNSVRTKYLGYFWLTHACSSSSSSLDCPTNYLGNKIPNSGVFSPQISYLKALPASDPNSFCYGSSSCYGRQIAPKCNYDFNSIPWSIYKRNIDSLVNGRIDLAGTPTSEFTSHSRLVSSRPIGFPDMGGDLWLELKAFLENPISKKVISSQSTKVRLNISSRIDPQGFAYISAGYFNSDMHPISIVGLHVKNSSAGSSPYGTILLNQNSNSLNCSSIPRLFNLKSNPNFTSSEAYIPKYPSSLSGGLLVHSTRFPNSPTSLVAQGTPNPINLKRFVVKTPEVTLINYNRGHQIYDVENLFLLKDSTLYIETNDSNPVTIRVADSIDISHGARLCNVIPGSRVCGSGKPSNLTIEFNDDVWRHVSPNSDYRFVDSQQLPSSSKQFTFSNNESRCSVRAGGLGDLIATNDNSSLNNPRPNSQQPGPSFSVASTGLPTESLNSLIYGKFVSFNSVGTPRALPLHKLAFFQSAAVSTRTYRSPNIVIHRGRLSLLDHQNNLYLLLSPQEVSYTPSRITLNHSDPHRKNYSSVRISPDSKSMADTFVLALSDPNTSSEKIWVGFNQRTNQLIVRTYSYPNSTYNRGWNGAEKVKEIHLNTSVPSITHGGIMLPTTVSLSNGALTNSLKSILLSRYDINLSTPLQSSVFQDRVNRIHRYSSSSRNYKGLAWVRHFCLGLVSRYSTAEDYVTRHNWTFDEKFTANVLKRYNYLPEKMEMGLRTYKGQNILSWDNYRRF